MELSKPDDEYDRISENVRRVSAQRFTELINGLQPLVTQCLADPDGLWDVEPGRIQAHVALIKLQGQLIKELGALYRVTAAPVVREDPTLIPASTVAQMLAEQEARMEAAVLQAAEQAAAATRLELEQQEVLSLEAARSRVTAALEKLKQEQV